MTRYALNLPNSLKRDAERLAREQGVSLNQFILWSVAEKVGGLLQGLDDPNFPNVTYRRGATAQGSAIFTYNIRDFIVLGNRYLRHGGIILAFQISMNLNETIRALNRLLRETDAEE